MNPCKTNPILKTPVCRFFSAAALASFFLLLPAPAPGADSELRLEQDIDDAIDRGVQYLLAEIPGPGGWNVQVMDYYSGYIALQVYALLKNDVSWSHPLILEGLRLLEADRLNKVYSASLLIMAYCALLEQLEEDPKAGGPSEFLDGPRPAQLPDRESALRKLRSACAWLINARVRQEGVWTYEALSPKAKLKTAPYDHSNSQFAILALGMAAQHGVSVPREVWTEVADHFVRVQEVTGDLTSSRPRFKAPAAPEAGKPKKTAVLNSSDRLYREAADIQARGWPYRLKEPDHRPTFSMTNAGQSSLLLAHRFLYGGLESSRLTGLERAIRDGYGWVCRTLDRTPRFQFKIYDLYSLEKVGDLGGVERFGDCAWFERGADQLIKMQFERGHWGPAGTAEARDQTSLALLFLARATSLEGPRAPLIRATGGPRGADDRFAYRYWVFLQSLGAEVPVIRFFRKLTYRPTRQLLKLSEEVLTAYDPDHLDELVYFIRGLEGSPFAKVREQGRRLLESLTGLKLADPAGYLDWASRWAQVIAIGRSRNARSGEDLRQWLRQSASHPLTVKILWALQRLNHRPALDDLLQMMESRDPATRLAAYQAALSLSGQDMPFHSDGSEKERSAELARWREWWARERESPREPRRAP